MFCLLSSVRWRQQLPGPFSKHHAWGLLQQRAHFMKQIDKFELLGSCRAGQPPEVLPQLQHIHTWRSDRLRQPHGITLVTQASAGRLHMLENQCTTYSDVIAAAVYVSLLNGRLHAPQHSTLHGQTVGTLRKAVAEFHSRMEAEGGLTRL